MSGKNTISQGFACNADFLDRIVKAQRHLALRMGEVSRASTLRYLVWLGLEALEARDGVKFEPFLAKDREKICGQKITTNPIPEDPAAEVLRRFRDEKAGVAQAAPPPAAAPMLQPDEAPHPPGWGTAADELPPVERAPVEDQPPPYDDPEDPELEEYEPPPLDG